MERRVIGRRLSFQGNRCTVKYVGKIRGKDNLWLGIEWDDDTKGKHDGSLNGHRYFHCLSPSPTAASFIRPNRKADTPLSVLQAIRHKYARLDNVTQPVRISGKTVEEVGFDKIREQLQDIQALRTIILDELCVSFEGPDFTLDQQTAQLEGFPLQVRELDLSDNLLETWSGVQSICTHLSHLKSLSVAGNRFSDLDDHAIADEDCRLALPIESLDLERTLLTWTQVAHIVSELPELDYLNVSRNNITRVTQPLRASNITTLDLSFNDISSLKDLAPLSALSELNHLSLRCNPIAKLSYKSGIISNSLTRLDLANTHLQDLHTLDNIPRIFPSLNWLLTKDTPLYEIASANLFTISRLSKLRTLNHVNISIEERQNAEIYYLGTIAKELEKSLNESEDTKILQYHRRWRELCIIYGKPNIERPSAHKIDPNTLLARTVLFTFYAPKADCEEARRIFEAKYQSKSPHPQYRNPTSHAATTTDDASTKDQPQNQAADLTAELQKATLVEPSQFSLTDKQKKPNPPITDDFLVRTASMPSTTSIYALQGIVGRLFDLPPPFPTTIRLVHETYEWDSSAKISNTNNKNNPSDDEHDSEYSLSQDDSDVYNDVKRWQWRRKLKDQGKWKDDSRSKKGRWVLCTEEMPGSTRSLADRGTIEFGPGKEARVRVFIRYLK